MEVWFYHLQSQPLERALPALLEKALERPWRVVVQTVDDLRVKALDDLLWTYNAESFLPHAAAREKSAADQPVVLTRDGDDPNKAQMRIFVHGAEIAIEPQAGYERVLLLFDGSDDVELEAARRQWSRLKGDGLRLAYWQQNEAGRWTRQM